MIEGGDESPLDLGGIIPPTTGKGGTLREAAERFKPRVEGYDIDKRIGEGGMATVWQATQLSTGRKVALKLLSAGPGSENFRKRFEREVQLTARLEHPHIARVYDSGVRHGVYYYAMELIWGEPLDEFVRSRGMGERQMLELMHDVVMAVQYAHQQGVIHRDLKPTNVLVSPDGHPHVLDFGLARAVKMPEGMEHRATTVSTHVSVDGEVAGTPAYMSPEQAAGQSGELDTRTDVYSLGVMLFNLLTGKYPHDVSGPHHSVMMRIQEEEPIRPRDVMATIDPDLEALLLKALARRREDRYQSAGELAHDLENYLNGDPLQARRPTTLYFLKKRLRKHRAAAAVGVMVAMVVAVEAIIKFPAALIAAALSMVAATAGFALFRIRHERDAARREHARTASLLRASDAMSRQRNLQDLWTLILTEARELTSSDAGSLFIRRGDVLEFVVAQNKTLAGRLGEEGVARLFHATTVPVSDASISGYVALTGKLANIRDVRQISSRLPFRYNPEFDQRNNYQGRSILAVPLTDPDGTVLGVLQLINRQAEDGTIIPFDQDLERLITSLASLAAVALRFHQLRGPQREFVTP